jgi:hypothetical protein
MTDELTVSLRYGNLLYRTAPYRTACSCCTAVLQYQPLRRQPPSHTASARPTPPPRSTLLSLSRHLRARRAAAGALQLASPEVKFEIDATTQDPMDVGMYQVKGGARLLYSSVAR